MNNVGNYKIRILYSAIPFIAVFVTVAACPPRIRPERCSLDEYILAGTDPSRGTTPAFNYSVRLDPIVMEARPVGKLKPNKVFAGDFKDEFRRGLVAYFKRKGTFAQFDIPDGPVALEVNIAEYQGGVGVPSRMSLKVNMKYYHVSTGVIGIIGQVGAFVDDCGGDVRDPVSVSLGDSEKIMRMGTVRMAQICHKLFANMEKQFLDNRDNIDLKFLEVME